MLIKLKIFSSYTEKPADWNMQEVNVGVGEAD